MAIEYNNIYFHIKRRPSRKSMMVCIPFYMYRIETNEFEHGLNFFQKIVLKFKARPGIKDEAIAEYTGLDSKLIGIVTGELQAKQLINDHGSLSVKGKEKLMEVDGLVINSGKKKIGYVFKYVNQDKLYPYYISQVVPADLIEDSKRQHPKIVTGTKGDGEDFTDLPFFLDEAIKTKSNYNRPSEREVLQLIQNSNRKGINQEEDEAKNEKLSNQLSVRFLNDQPEVIWACSYVYLHQHEDETYEPDWRMLDPFGFGDNVALKFYINNPVNKHLLESIKNRFGNEITSNQKKYSEVTELLNNELDDLLLSEFDYGLTKKDINIQKYVKLILESRLKQKYLNFESLLESKGYHSLIIELFEAILKEDKVKREFAYLDMINRYDNDYNSRFFALSQLWKSRNFSNTTSVPPYLKSVCKSSLKFSKGIGGMLVGLFLTYNIDNKSPLYKLFNNRIDLLIDVIDYRNPDSHGRISSEGLLKPFPKEVVEESFFFIKFFINDYIQNS